MERFCKEMHVRHATDNVCRTSLQWTTQYTMLYNYAHNYSYWRLIIGFSLKCDERELTESQQLSFLS